MAEIEENDGEGFGGDIEGVPRAEIRKMATEESSSTVSNKEYNVNSAFNRVNKNNSVNNVIENINDNITLDQNNIKTCEFENKSEINKRTKTPLGTPTDLLSASSNNELFHKQQIQYIDKQVNHLQDDNKNNIINKLSSSENIQYSNSSSSMDQLISSNDANICNFQDQDGIKFFVSFFL